MGYPLPRGGDSPIVGYLIIIQYEMAFVKPAINSSNTITTKTNK